MTKINLDKKIFLFLIALISYTGMKAQTCGAPITLTVNTGFTAIDSTNLPLTYYTFTATNTQHSVKFWVKNSSGPVKKFNFKCYTNNCGSLPASQIVSITQSNADTFYIDLPSITNGVAYLLELQNFTSTYLVNRISINNTLHSSLANMELTCPSSYTACTGANPCDLVCNGSFECHSQPTPSVSGISDGNAYNWNTPNYTSADLFSTSFATSTGVSSPCNYFGYQFPHLGNSYAGIIWATSWGETPWEPNYSEYLQTKLTNTLIYGVPYTCSMWVRNGDNNPDQLGISQLGIYLTTGSLSIPTQSMIPNTPTAVETNTTLLNSVWQWKKIVLTFTATGGEDYLSIGRPASSSTFAASTVTSTCGTYGPSPRVYLYIDNVSLVPTLTVTANANFPVSCSGAQVNLTATSNNGSTTFTWMPGNLTGSSVNVTPTVTTTYTLLASVPGCTATNTASAIITVTVTPQVITTSPSVTICATYSTALSATASVAPASFTWMPGSLTGSSVSVTPTTTTIYTVTGTAANGCSSTKTVEVAVITPLGFFSVSGNSLLCTNQGQTTTTLTASGTHGLSYTWTPGGPFYGNTQTFTPSATTVYTITALSSGCPITNTFAVAVQSACCTSTVPALTSYSVTGATITGPKVINFDLTIYGTNTVTALMNGEFLIAPNVQIKVIGNGNEIRLIGAHLYACGTNMWKGIDIADGSRFVSYESVSTGNSTLIEDAITAVNLGTVSSIAMNVPLEISNTIFNKNYTSILVGNVTTNTTNIQISKTVFTSRTLTFTQTSWPTTSEASPGLRYAATSTTGLTPPYTLQSAAISVLKSPYTNQSARYGVIAVNAGYTSGSNYYGVAIGTATNNGASDFNLFDALMWSIDGFNSNVTSINNVFQNTQRVYFCPRCYYDGGTAIRSTVTTNLNAKLDMTATGTYSTNYSVGNRFWNCHKAVEANNVYRLDCNYATFRSTQTTTNATSALLLPGAYGINSNTNRFEHNIRYNSFNNINTPVWVNLASGTYTYGAGSYSGILANNLFIDYNYFGAQLTNITTLGSAFLNHAVYLSSATTAGWSNVASVGTRLSNNQFDRAWRGVYISGFAYPSTVQNNTVNIIDDGTVLTDQWGIKVAANAASTPVIQNNLLNAANTTNTLVTLVYVGSSIATAVTCNTLSTSYQGFEFNSNNTGTVWRGNSMTSHNRAMVLSSSGIIGPQGSLGSPSDNKWNSGITNSTYLVTSSDAANSKLYTKVGSPWQSTSDGGTVAFGFWYNAGTNTISTTGTYVCGTIPPPAKVIVVKPDQTMARGSNPNANINSSMQYISDNITYRYLDANPDIKNNDPEYLEFYNNKAGSSIDVFNQTEKALSAGQLAQAQSLNNSVNEVNPVETNYSNYYGIYERFKSDSTLSSQDSSLLLNIASLCPGNDGPVVYQARSLYNLYTGKIKAFKENCVTEIDNENVSAKITNLAERTKSWNIDLFPNPTTGAVNLVSGLENEVLQVTVIDVTGKVIFKNTVNTSNFIANLELNAKAGIYLITIKNSKNESITKKLVIAD